MGVWKGGRAERLAVLFYIGVYMLTKLTDSTDPRTIHYVVQHLFGDLIIASFYLVLAVRYSSLWMAAAMVAAGLQSAVHAFRLEDDYETLSRAVIWGGLQNLLFLLMIAAIFVGTISAWRQRIQDRRREASRSETALGNQLRPEPA